MVTTRVIASAISIFAACIIGCSDGKPATYPVSGSVHFADELPLRTGFVQLLSQSGGPTARGKIASDGTFQLGTFEASDGAPAGDYVAVIVQHTPPVSPSVARSLGPEHDDHAANQKVVSLKYASRETSDLSCTVSRADRNHFEFTVEPQQPRRLMSPKS